MHRPILVLLLAFTTIAICEKLTLYWVVFESDYPLGSDATLSSCDGRQLAKVSNNFAEKIALEGSGYLRDGKTVLNLGSCVGANNPCKSQSGNNYKCFIRVNAPKGIRGNDLAPFVSVAANDVAFGTTGIMSVLKGKKLPSGEVHDGCVRVDDTCSTCTHGKWLDYYIYRERNQGHFNKDQSTQFTQQKCTPKKYRV